MFAILGVTPEEKREFKQLEKEYKQVKDIDLLSAFQEAKRQGNKLKEDLFLKLLYSRIKKVTLKYCNTITSYEKTYPGYLGEFESRFLYQMLRRFDPSYSEIEEEIEGKKRGQRLGKNGITDDKEKNFNLQSIAIAVARTTHQKTVQDLNGGLEPLKTLKEKWKRNEAINHLSAFSDFENNQKQQGNDIQLEVEDKTAEGDYYSKKQICDLIHDYYQNFPKRLKSIFRKEMKMNKELTELELLQFELENFKNGIISKLLTKMIKDDILKRNKTLFGEIVTMCNGSHLLATTTS